MVVLLMFSTALKDLAVELNVFLMTSTQVTPPASTEKGQVKNQNYIRGAKSIADKADVGVIISEVNQDELNLLERIVKKYQITPNQVTDIYKNRGGKYKNTRIWSLADLGTCRKTDLFITDANYNIVENFKKVVVTNEDFELYNKTFRELELNEVKDENSSKVSIDSIIMNEDTGEILLEEKEEPVEEPIVEEKKEEIKKEKIEEEWDDFF